MCQDDASLPDRAASALQRVAELEAENERLRQALAEAGHRGERLRGELQHRVRNVLAVIRSVARRTALTSRTAEDYVMHWEGRLDAIARGQVMLMRDPEGRIDLKEMVEEALLVHAAREGERVSLAGAPITLRGKTAENIGLALHELAVNAVKYGALCEARGRIVVTWQVEQGPVRKGETEQVLRLEWRESGVPLLSEAPRHKGFGTELIERTLAYELGATASCCFAPDGIRWAILVPLPKQIVAPAP